MPNIALHKKIEEAKIWVRPESLTDGVILGYDGDRGFAAYTWPTYLTLDLEAVHQIKTIRFLLWDNKGNPNNKRHPRIYKYRLLISTNHREWLVMYDSSDNGINGWQEFIFDEKVDIRYIRIHCLFNSANQYFHIVELEAHDDIPRKLDAEITLSKNVLPKTLDIENKDGLPITFQMETIVKNLEEIPQKYSILKTEEFQNIILAIKSSTKDIETIEKSITSIRNQIINPVNDAINYSNKIGRTSVRLGLTGGIIGLISIILSIISLIIVIKSVA